MYHQLYAITIVAECLCMRATLDNVEHDIPKSLQLKFNLLFDSMATATTATAPSSTRPSITSHKELVRNVLTDEATIITWLQRRHLLADSMTCSKWRRGLQVGGKERFILVEMPNQRLPGARLFGASVTRAFFPGAT